MALPGDLPGAAGGLPLKDGDDKASRCIERPCPEAPSDTLPAATPGEIAEVAAPESEASAEALDIDAASPSEFRRKPREVMLDEFGKPLSNNAAKRLRRDQRWEEGREQRKYERLL